MEDQLSALPNEIIIAILTMKEAARTSVLSLKWKNLWKFFTGSLNFDASKTKASMRQEIETMSLETERTNYVCSLSWGHLYWTWILWFPREVTSSPTYFQNFVILSGWNCKLLHMKTKASHSSLP